MWRPEDEGMNIVLVNTICAICYFVDNITCLYPLSSISFWIVI